MAVEGSGWAQRIATKVVTADFPNKKQKSSIHLFLAKSERCRPFKVKSSKIPKNTSNVPYSSSCSSQELAFDYDYDIPVASSTVDAVQSRMPFVQHRW